MSLTIKFDPSVTQPQAVILPDATPRNDGVMTKEQAALLAQLGSGGDLAKLNTLIAPVEVLQASGPIGLTQYLSALITFTGPLAFSLAPGFDGQQKWLTLPFGVNPAVITPVGGFTTGQTTLTFSTSLDYAILVYVGFAGKWGVFTTTGVLA